MSDLFRFAAFISYSSKDAAFARRLHRALEGYNIPVQLGRFDLVGGGKKNRIFPVFRDREELPSGELGEAIEAALKASNALIIVCSPHAAASPWVNKEIETFLALGRHERIFAIIAEDAPLTDEAGGDATSSSFPPAFRGEGLADGAQGFEPLAADARKGKDGFRNAWLKVVAGLVGVNAGALQDRDKKRRRAQRRRITVAASAVVLLGLVGAAAFDALQWRSALYQQADNTAREGRAAEASPLTLAAMPAPFSLLPMRDDGADPLARTLGAARLVTDLGVIFRFDLSETGNLLVVVDASQRAIAYDSVNGRRTELGRLVQYKILPDGSGVIVLRADEQGTVELFDTGKSALSVRGMLGRGSYYPLAISGDGKRVLLNDLRGDEAAVFDLNSGSVTRLSSIRRVREALMSANGSRILIQRDDQLQSVVLFDFNARSTLELGAFPQTEFAFAPNGARLWVRYAQTEGSIYDLRTGRKTDLGPLSEFATSPMGDRLLVQHADANGTAEVIDLNSGRGVALGNLGPLMRADFLDEGSKIFVWRADETGTAAILDLKNGAKKELGPLGEQYSDTVFAASGWRASLIRPTSPRTTVVLDLRDGRLIDLGAIGDAQGGEKLSADGATLFIQREEGLTVIDLTRSVDTSDSGTALVSSICAANAHALRPFLPSLRDAKRFAAGATSAASDGDRRTFATLRGRPWNPCDWRGIAAVFPDSATGNGWFEGLRQWLKLMSVRYFGAADFKCEESTFGAMEAGSGDKASAARRAARARMCALYGPSAQAG